MNKTTAFLSGLLIVTGCAAPPQTAPLPSRDVYFRAPADRVWEAVLVLLVENELPIENMERASWFVRTQEMVIPATMAADSLIDCGTDMMMGSRASSQPSRFRATILLRPAGDSTAMRLQTMARQTTGAGETTCVSKGAIERRLVAQLQERLARR